MTQKKTFPNSQLSILFDLDGTLVDSEPVARRAWQQFLTEQGHGLTHEAHSGIVGMRAWDSANHILQYYGLSLSVAEILEAKRVIWEALWRVDIQTMPGLYPLLAFLDENKVRWGVVTSSNRAYAEEMLGLLGLRHRAGILVTGDDVKMGKPDPEPYLLGATLLGVDPASCWVVEDSRLGMMAGVNAGMKVFTMPSPYMTADQRPEGVTTIQSLADLIKAL